MCEIHCTTRDYTKSAVSLCQGSPTCIVPSDARQPLSATLLTLTESLRPPRDAAVHKQTSSLPKEGCHGLGQSRVFLSCGSQVWLSNIRVCRQRSQRHAPHPHVSPHMRCGLNCILSAQCGMLMCCVIAETTVRPFPALSFDQGLNKEAYSDVAEPSLTPTPRLRLDTSEPAKNPTFLQGPECRSEVLFPAAPTTGGAGQVT